MVRHGFTSSAEVDTWRSRWERTWQVRGWAAELLVVGGRMTASHDGGVVIPNAA